MEDEDKRREKLAAHYAETESRALGAMTLLLLMLGITLAAVVLFAVVLLVAKLAHLW